VATIPQLVFGALLIGESTGWVELSREAVIQRGEQAYRARPSGKTDAGHVGYY